MNDNQYWKSMAWRAIERLPVFPVEDIEAAILEIDDPELVQALADSATRAGIISTAQLMIVSGNRNCPTCGKLIG